MQGIANEAAGIYRPKKEMTMSWKYKIRRFVDDYVPVFCVVCRGLFFSKDIEYEVSTMGQTVPLCKKCHRELFTPFSKGE